MLQVSVHTLQLSAPEGLFGQPYLPVSKRPWLAVASGLTLNLTVEGVISASTAQGRSPRENPPVWVDNIIGCVHNSV